MRANFRAISITFFIAVFFAGIAAASPAINWSDLNPNLQGATLVADISICSQCHEHYAGAFSKTKHHMSFKATGDNCQSCHGPASKHVEDPYGKTILSFKDPEVASTVKNTVCLGCHEMGIRMHWKGSAHDMSNIACNACHYIMGKRSGKNLFIDEDSKTACIRCHSEQRARLMRSSHMPLREGKMDCASCHNPHGGHGPTLLKGASVNETCYECHADKRGPLLWEHAPVRELCTNCHDPHGSNNEALLKIRVPYLCQSCHSVTTHNNTLYSGSRLPGGSGTTAIQLVGKGCLNCHSLVHGSNHPSGAKLQR